MVTGLHIVRKSFVDQMFVGMMALTLNLFLVPVEHFVDDLTATTHGAGVDLLALFLNILTATTH
jgi:hypothetical protein